MQIYYISIIDTLRYYEFQYKAHATPEYAMRKRYRLRIPVWHGLKLSKLLKRELFNKSYLIIIIIFAVFVKSILKKEHSKFIILLSASRRPTNDNK